MNDLEQITITVGDDNSDIVGFTNQHIQAAIDRVSFLNGGTVVLSAGRFDCADAVHLRSGVSLVGQGADTVLRKNAMKSSSLTSYMAYGHEDLVVEDPSLFNIGDGFIVGDDKTGGFSETQGTIIAKKNGYLIANTRHNADYLHYRGGIVKTLYPLLSVIEEHDVKIQGITLEGNSSENDTLNGCRGGAFFAHFSNNVHVIDVHVRDFNGEGFSFQTCNNMHIEQCTAESCWGNGFHPGSGSISFHIHNCKSSKNKLSGFFYCVRVRNGLLENCEFLENEQHGVSIGERDVDSVNRLLLCKGNEQSGIFFRGGDGAVASHNTFIQGCKVIDNAGPQVHVRGAVENVKLTDNLFEGDLGLKGEQEVVSLIVEGNTNTCTEGLVDLRS